jgi:hypothetical protein
MVYRYLVIVLLPSEQHNEAKCEKAGSCNKENQEASLRHCAKTGHVCHRVVNMRNAKYSEKRNLSADVKTLVERKLLTIRRREGGGPFKEDTLCRLPYAYQR